MADSVNHPSHYNTGSIEVIDAIEDWQLGFHAGNVVKYVARHKHKAGLEDLRKAQWYLARLIELETQGTNHGDRQSKSPQKKSRRLVAAGTDQHRNTRRRAQKRSRLVAHSK